jgi:hypothetical protein
MEVELVTSIVATSSTNSISIRMFEKEDLMSSGSKSVLCMQLYMKFLFPLSDPGQIGRSESAPLHSHHCFAAVKLR